MKKISEKTNLFKFFWKEIVFLITSFATLITFFSLKSCDKNNNVDGEALSSTISSSSFEDVIYTVKSKDTLSEIANFFQVPMIDIATVNNITDYNKINADMKLIIPRVSSEIALKYNEGIKNNENKVNVNYVVEANDSINAIAARFGVSSDSIIKYNKIVNSDEIYVGSTLIIPEVNKDLAEKYKQVDNSTINNLPDGYVRGIDISSWNGELDWDLMEQHYKAGKFNYIILRMAENYNAKLGKREFTLDKCFEKNLSECNKRGIPYGVYVFSRGSNEEEINTETKSIINYINNNLNRTKVVNGETLDLNFNLSLPFYMDCFETDAKSQFNLYVQRKYDECAKLIKLWCDEMESAGYFTGVYCSANFAKDMGISRLSDYSLWLAHYGRRDVGNVENIGLNGKVTFSSIIKSQQVTDAGTLDGFSGYFDVNITDEKLITLVQSFYSAQRSNVANINRMLNPSNGELRQVVRDYFNTCDHSKKLVKKRI